MKRLLLPVVGIASVLIIPAAQAGTVIWDLGSSINTYAQGASFTSTTGGETVNIFAEQVTDTGSPGGSGTIQTPEGGTGSGSTLCSGGNTTSGTCLFSVNATDGNIDSGIGPYAPAEGGSPYTGQQGIADDGDLHDADNVLYIELGSSIAAGSTVSFLLQAGDQGGASVTAYSSNTSSPFNLTSTTQINSTPISIATSSGSDPNAAGSLTATNTSDAQLTITRDSAATQFIAIQADCTYILLDQIAVTTPAATTPEPRFYGMLLAGLLGIAVTLRRRFVTA